MLIVPVPLHGSETWVPNRKSENVLVSFEGKTLQRILGLINNGGVWRKINNEKLYNLLSDMTII